MAAENLSVTFFQDKPVTCPACNCDFKREVLRQGRGRLIAGDLMPDLRRSYKPSPKYGLINPLIYQVQVCPSCLYASLTEDFLRTKMVNLEKINEEIPLRRKYYQGMFGMLDFEKPRDLYSGTASYLLAIASYAHHGKETAPTTKKAECAIRASWLCLDINQQKPGEGYDSLAEYFRVLSWKCYDRAVEHATNGQEDFGNIKHYGPDCDVNFGYEGVLYMSCFLGIEQSVYWDDKDKYERFKRYRTMMAKVFGFGKSSKEKPGPLLDASRDMHETIGSFLSENRDKYETDPRAKLFDL